MIILRMPASNKAFNTAAIVIFVLLLASCALAKSVEVGHVKAEVISELKSIVPGQPFWAGLRLQIDPHWHVYWRNPGDAGTPPQIKWMLPDGFQVSEINWPLPEYIKQPPLAAYGYNGEVLLPVLITPPDNLIPKQQIDIYAHAEWLVCQEKCIPGEVDLSMTLQVAEMKAELDDQWSNDFSQVRNNLPVTIADWEVRAISNDKGYEIALTAPSWFTGSLDSCVFYPYNKLVVDYSAEQEFSYTDSLYELQLQKSRYQVKPIDTLRGVLITKGGWRGDGSEMALEINVPVESDYGEKRPAVVSTTTNHFPLWKALIFALLGGIILNLMPCVLPVLSIKILNFIQQAADEKKETHYITG